VRLDPIGYRKPPGPSIAFSPPQSPLPKMLLFADYASGLEELMTQFAVTAKAHKGELFFVKGLPEPNAGALSYFGLSAETDLPAIVIHDTDKDIKHKVVGVSASTLESSVVAYLDGSLKPFIKSEAIPADNAGPVFTAVADNWMELMEVDTVDSLVMFYAPWYALALRVSAPAPGPNTRFRSWLPVSYPARVRPGLTDRAGGGKRPTWQVRALQEAAPGDDAGGRALRG
jgi:hypothetical protein